MRPWLGSLILVGGCGLTPGELVLAEPTTSGVAHEVARPTDPAPEIASTPEGSLAARPHWAAAGGYAPMLAWDEARVLFDRAPSTPRDRPLLDGATLACRIDVTFSERKDWALRPARWSSADLYLAFGFGVGVVATDRHALQAIGPNQSNTSFFVAPSVRLAEGDAIDVLVNDRDRLLDLDYIDRLGALYGGTMPMVMAGEYARVECRELDGALLEEVVRERLWQVDDALARWRRAEADAAPEAVIEALSGVAAVVGWDDARVLRRMDQGAVIEREHRRRAAERIAGLRAASGGAREPVGLGGRALAIAVDGVRCGAAELASIEAETGGLAPQERCVVDVVLHNRSRDETLVSLADGPGERWRWWVLDSRARRMGLRVLGAEPDALALAAGGHRRVRVAVADAPPVRGWFAGGDEVSTPAEPALLVIEETRGARRVLRLALGAEAPAAVAVVDSPRR